VIPRAVLIGALVSLAAALPAQQLPDRLSRETRSTLLTVIDSGRRAGIPTEPLVAKVAEGVLKGADDERIVVAVRRLTQRMGEARAVLGTSNAAVLTAAASALQGGIPSASLVRLAARANGVRDLEGELTLALVTLADLMRQRVPVSPALVAVEALLERRASGEDYAQLRLGVTESILAGSSPEQSVSTRADAILRRLSRPNGPPD
jgi:hypothetical protein